MTVDGIQTLIGEACFECLDVVRCRWPFKVADDVVSTAKADPHTKSSILDMKATRKAQPHRQPTNFLEQDVDEMVEIYMTYEQPAVPMTTAEFQTQFGKHPKTVPGVVVHPITTETGKIEEFVLSRDQSCQPRVVLATKTTLRMSERKFKHESQLAADHGRDIFSALVPRMGAKGIGIELPTAAELREHTRQAAASEALQGMAVVADATFTTAGGDAALLAESVAVASPNSKPKGQGQGSTKTPKKKKGGEQDSAVRARPPLSLPAVGGSNATSDLSGKAKRRRVDSAETMTLPSVWDCVLGQGGCTLLNGQTRTQAQRLWHFKQQLEGKVARLEISTAEKMQTQREYNFRVQAANLTAGHADNLPETEFCTCFLALCGSGHPLPARLFVTALQRAAKKVATQHPQRTPELHVQQLAAIMSLASEQVTEPMEALPMSLREVPPTNLSEEERWQVALDFCQDTFLPALMKSVTGDVAINIIAAARGDVETAWSGGAIAPAAHAVAQRLRNVLAIAASPFTPAPNTRDVVSLLTGMQQSNVVEMEVLRELTRDGWWATEFKKTLANGMTEADFADDIDTMTKKLRGDKTERMAAMKALTDDDGWRKWSGALQERPVALKGLESAALQHVRGLIDDENTLVDELLSVNGFATWMSKHGFATAEWEALQKAASTAHRDRSAGTRWEEAMKAATNLASGGSAPRGQDTTQAIEVTAAFQQCVGHRAEVDQQNTLVALCVRQLSDPTCTAAETEAYSTILTFCGEATQHKEADALCQICSAGHVARQMASGGSAPGGQDTTQAIEKVAHAVAAFGRAKAIVTTESTIAAAEAFSDDVAKCDAMLVTLRADKAEAETRKVQDAIRNLEECMVAWKEKLPETATWSTTVKEIEYHFWKSEGQDSTPVIKIETAFGKLHTVLESREELSQRLGLAVDSTTAEAAKKAMGAAKLLCTEEYLVRMIEQHPDEAVRKVTKRMGQINEDFKYTAIHAAIRAKVRELTGL